MKQKYFKILLMSLFSAFLLWSLWTTIALRNIHDKPTRDLLAATLDSPARLHASVWSAAALMSLPFIVTVTVYIAIIEGEPRVAIGAFGAFLSTTCGTVIGLTLGSWLHPPVTNNRSAGHLTPYVMFSLVSCIALITLTTASARWDNTRASSN